MDKRLLTCVSTAVLAAALTFPGCANPTLVQVARRRQVNTNAANAALRGEHNVKDDVNVVYHVTDLDVLNFTDEVKRNLDAHASLHTSLRYGSATTQATLGALAGAATVIGWGVRTASGLGLGATYVFGIGQIFGAKEHAQAYEQAFTAVQAAESAFYFRQVGLGFKSDPAKPGKFIVDRSGIAAADGGNIPRADRLTPDGETLYYRVSKILKVLDDVLAAKIPDLQDLKDAKGDTSGSTSPTLAAETIASPKPLKTAKAPPAPTPDPQPASTSQPAATSQPASTPPPPPAESDYDALHNWWKPQGKVDIQHGAQFDAWLSQHKGGMDIATFLRDPHNQSDWPAARKALIH